MKIEITKGGIYDGNGLEIPIGTELNVSKDPVAWAGRYRIISEGKGDKSFAVGKKVGDVYQILKGDEVLVAEVTKEESAAFNKMDDAAKAAFIEEKTKA